MLAALGVMTTILAAPAAAHAASAVVLVSGFDTATPFSTSDPSCAGKEGPTWSDPNGPAAALKAAGYTVFTAPVAQSGEPTPAPCVGSGQAAPPASATIDSNGDVTANGAALDDLLTFLATSYGVTSVQIVGHSDGGLWSRSAITQLAAGGATGVTVQSLTTLGTPHTGSFGADIAETLQNGRCDESSVVEQAICDAVLDVIEAEFAGLGQATIEQLSSTYLEGWNPQQTIGCPVTVMGGTYVDIPYVPGFLDYYDPDDGIVGEASSLAEASTSITLQPIPAPGFQAIGRQTFPVVHSSVLTFLSPDTLLNQADISAAVVQSVQANATGTPCATGPSAPATTTPATVSTPPATVTTPPATVAPVAAAAAARPVRVRAGFRSVDVPRRGRLARPSRGELVLLLDHATVRCRGRAVTAVPVLGSRRLRASLPRCSGALRVTGGRALAMRPDARRSIRIARSGRSLRVTVRGPRLRGVHGRMRVSGRWRPLAVGAATRLPARAGRVSVRVIGRDRGGEREAATAHVAS